MRFITETHIFFVPYCSPLNFFHYLSAPNKNTIK